MATFDNLASDAVAIWSEYRFWGLSVLAGAPLLYLIAQTALSNFSSIEAGEATAILGFLGFVGTVAQFGAQPLLQSVDRTTFNGGEILIPVVAAGAAAVGTLVALLPGGPFDSVVRTTLRTAELIPSRSTSGGT